MNLFSDPFRDSDVPLAPDQLELRKLTLKTIEADPGGFNMEDWEWEEEEEYRLGRGVCRTTRCGAGWAQYLARGAVYEDGDVGLGIPPVDQDAIQLLGLTVEEYGTNDIEGIQNGALFYATRERFIQRLRGLASVEI